MSAALPPDSSPGPPLKPVPGSPVESAWGAARRTGSRSTPSHLSGRDHSVLDRLIIAADQAVRTLLSTPTATSPSPAVGIQEITSPSADRTLSIALMRINHSGEVAAQALYQGQALVASNPDIRASLLQAGAEETDHLVWCAERVRELGGRTSFLAPIWYVGSFAIGTVAGLSGDRNSLGFVAETERQVAEHLTDHLLRLPAEDVRSRSVLEQMRADEVRHGNAAVAAGGAVLPSIARAFMRLTAKVMTRTAYWL